MQDIATSEKATEGCNDPGSKDLSSSPGTDIGSSWLELHERLPISGGMAAEASPV